MEFKTIQHKETKEILMYFVNNKRVSRSKFLHLEHIQWLRGGKYSNSLTSRTKSNNFRHTATL